MLTAKLVTTEEELAQIARLSASNLVTNISVETKAAEGFVTWSYPLATLKLLHALQPSVTVKDHDIVAGYALVLTRECTVVYPPLKGMIEHMRGLPFRGQPLLDHRVYVMGQICVHPAYRGKGVVDLLYQFHRQEFSSRFDLLVTEISTSNIRSMKAHLKTGFNVIDTYRDEQDEWNVVLWDWRSQRGSG